MRSARRSRSGAIAGTLLVIVGVLCNKWVLGRLLASDGEIEGGLFAAAIAAFELAAIGLGIALLSGRRPTITGRAANVALLVGALVSALGIAEAILRIAPIPAIPTAGALDLLQPNPRGTGSFRLRPNVRARARVGSQPVIVSTNSFGMPWREVALAKPRGKTRIAFVGDSFTFGCWVDSVANSLVGVFESQIDSGTYEVLNFGVGGYGLADIRLQLAEEVFRFQPDYVVLLIFNGNDVRDTYLGANWYDLVGGSAHWNHDRLAAAIPASYRPRDDVSPAWSQLFGSLRLARIASMALAGRAPAAASETGLTVDDSFMSFSFWSRRPYPPVADSAIRVTLATLEGIRRDTEARDAKLVVGTIPYAQQVYVHEATGPGYDIGLPQRHLLDFAASRGIPAFDLLPPLRRHVAETGEQLYWSTDPHFNQRGHRVAALLLAEYFLDLDRTAAHPALASRRP